MKYLTLNVKQQSINLSILKCKDYILTKDTGHYGRTIY